MFSAFYCTFYVADATCNLRAINLITDVNMQVSGSDGIHPHVQSSVKVKVRTYTDQTLSAASVARVSGITAQQFVSKSDIFLSSINKHVISGERARLLALQETGNYVDLYLVLQKADHSYSSLAPIIFANKPAIQRDSGLTISTVNRNVCNDDSCSGRGQCRSQVVINEQLDYTSTDSLILTYHTASLVPKCDCEQEYMGEDCSLLARACRSTPCMNGATCVPIGSDDFSCTCTSGWKGSQCQDDVNECDNNYSICMNGGM